MLFFSKTLFLSCLLLSSLSNAICNNLIDTTKYNACIFIYAVECPRCSYADVNNKINYFSNKNITPNLIIKNIRPQQIKKVNVYIKKQFNNCNILYDTNSHYSKKFKILNDNDVIITDSKFNLVQKLSDYTNFKIDEIPLGESSQIIVTKIDFEDDFPLHYYNTEITQENNILYIDDRIQKSLYYINIKSGKVIKKTSYENNLDYIKEHVSDTIYNQIIRDNINNSRILGFLNNGNNIEMIMYLLNKIVITDNLLSPKYSSYQYNFNTDNLSEIFNHNRYFFQSKNFLMLDDFIYTGIYDNIYYHTKHDLVKDSSAVLIRVKSNIPEIIFYLSKFEELTGSVYSYSFLPNILYSGLENIVVYNPLNSLLFSFNPDDIENIVNYKVEGKLKEIFESMKKINKFDIYEHKPFINPINIFSTSVKCLNGNVYILLIEKTDNKTDTYIQIYNVEGNLINEKKLDFFIKNDNILKSISLISVTDSKIIILAEWDKDFFEIFSIPYSNMLK